MIETIYFDGDQYPSFQANGFSSKFCFPYAKEFCKGRGLDVGCNRKEWAFPGSIPIDPLITPKYDAFNLPPGKYDYIISSHMLEHIVDWVGCLDYWFTKIKNGGWLYLYLPSYSQKYWRPWNNRKHIHIFTPQILRDYLNDRGWIDIVVSGDDLNNSFSVAAKKPNLLSCCGIYSITNKFNGKRYIGSTATSFFERFAQHKSCLKLNKHHSFTLQRAYNKRGLSAFKFEILETCDGLTRQEIANKETEYIIKYKTQMPDGYNIKPQATGNFRDHYQTLLLFDLNGVLIDEFNSSAEVSKRINVSMSTIQGSYKRQAKGMYSTIFGKWIVIQKDHLGKAVFKYPYTIYEVDENGTEIDSFYKYEDAGIKFNLGREGIRLLMKNNRPTAHGTFLITRNKKYPNGNKKHKSNNKS